MTVGAVGTAQEIVVGEGFTYLFAPKNLSDWSPGIQIDTTSCSDEQQTTIKQAVYSAREIGFAALEAATSADLSLFKIFFNITDRATVEIALGNVMKILGHRSSFPVVISCKDFLGHCTNDFAFAYLMASEAEDHSNSLAPLIVCPHFFSELPELPDPCNELSLRQRTAGTGLSRASTILHELMHITYVAGPSNREMQDFAYGSYGAIALKTKIDPLGQLLPVNRDGNPVMNADSYGVMGSWAWMREIQKHRCPDEYPLWGEVERLTTENAAAAAANHGNDTSLRKLLFDEDDSSQSQEENGQVETRQPDVYICDGICRVPCAQRPAGTLPTSECYPPLATEGENIPQAWGTYIDDDVPPEFISGASDFVSAFCPHSIATLCSFIGRNGLGTGTHDVWIWAVGRTKGCLAAVWLPNQNAIPPPDRQACRQILDEMSEALLEDPANRGRVSVNLARFPSMPDVRLLRSGFAGPVAVDDNGLGVNGSISSWLLQG